MKPLDTRGSRIGAYAERRFLEITTKRTPETPKWFYGVKRASVKADVSGVDMIAKIKRPDDSKPMSVPIQVKSSPEWVLSFYEKHPEAKRLKIPVIIVDRHSEPEAVRAALYKSLAPFLTFPRDHFKKFLEGIGRKALSPRGRLIKAHIRKERKKRK